jgi:hypothetical protein
MGIEANYNKVVEVERLTDDESGDTRELGRQAARLSRLWPRQNHLAMLILWGFGFFVLANLLLLVAFLPELLRMFLGVQTRFTLSGWHVLNSTFLATVGALKIISQPDQLRIKLG